MYMRGHGGTSCLGHAHSCQNTPPAIDGDGHARLPQDGIVAPIIGALVHFRLIVFSLRAETSCIERQRQTYHCGAGALHTPLKQQRKHGLCHHQHAVISCAV